jgi:hypothetical protein
MNIKSKLKVGFKFSLHKIWSSLMLGTFLSIGFVPLAKAQTNSQINSPTNDTSSKLTEKQKSILKSLGIAIAVPSYIPKGFRVSDIQIDPCPRDARREPNGVCRFGPSYTIIYRNFQNNCFEVNAIGGGLGGPDGKYSRKVISKILGEVDLNIDMASDRPSQPISKAMGKSPQNNMWTFPAGKAPFYQVATLEGKKIRDGKSTLCSSRAFMTPDELTKIVQSLDWLP